MQPVARPLGLIFVLLLLVPSAAYLWHNDDLPDFCDFHDDCVYFVSAKSLADGGGYRLESLPGQPSQTKYPPLYPLLLSIAWHIDPQFPHNVPLAAWISWLASPAVLILLYFYAPYLGLAGWRMWVFLALFALNPYTIWFGSQLLSEPLFLALTLVTMLLLERAAEPGAARGLALAAGLMAGMAYLSRTAGIAMLPVAVGYLWFIRKQRQKAWWFAAAMLPFIAAWTVWVRTHMLKTDDPSITYYTDYIAYQFYNVKLRDLHLVLWKNVDGLLLGLGSFVLPKIANSLPLKILAQVIAVAMISGVVRVVRQGHARLFTLFALGNAAMLTVWHFPPDERFVSPMYPLALTGLLAELEHLAKMLRQGVRHRDVSQRLAAAGLATIAVAIFGGCLAIQFYATAVVRPANSEEHRHRLVDRLAAYRWIAANTPKDAAVLANHDPALYLYTAHPSMRRSLPPKFWYREDSASTVDWWGNLAPFAHDHGVRYYFFMDPDPSLPVKEEDRDAIVEAYRVSPHMVKAFHQRIATVYRFGD